MKRYIPGGPTQGAPAQPAASLAALPVMSNPVQAQALAEAQRLSELEQAAINAQRQPGGMAGPLLPSHTEAAVPRQAPAPAVPSRPAAPAAPIFQGSRYTQRRPSVQSAAPAPALASAAAPSATSPSAPVAAVPFRNKP